MSKVFRLIAALAMSCFANFDDGATILYPFPFGYQCGYSLANKSVVSSMDANADFLFLSLGANVNQELSTKLYIGGGLGGFIQIQYGYNINKSQNVLRARADIPFSVFRIEKPEYLRWLCIGSFYEYGFGEKSGSTFGLNIGINTSLLIF
jgi:hypothetical protein